MRTTRFRHLAAAGLVAALSLTAAACSEDDGEATSAAADAPATPSTSAPAPMSAASQPFGPACASVPSSGAGSFTGMAMDPVATAASNNPALSTLVSAVQAAGLVDTLNSAEDITVFAPVDDAFAAVPQATLDAAMADPGGLLTKVLTGHVVQGRLTPADLEDGTFTTLDGTTIGTEGSGSSYTVEGADVVCGNVQTANATVYLIDGVLLPG